MTGYGYNNKTAHPDLGRIVIITWQLTVSRNIYIYTCTMHNEGPYEIMRNGMYKWKEVMNGASSALKDPNIITFKSRD